MTKANMVIMSQLSDLQEFNIGQDQRTKINFIKFLLLKYPDTNSEINPSREWGDFKNKHPNAKQGGILNKEVSFKELFTK